VVAWGTWPRPKSRAHTPPKKERGELKPRPPIPPCTSGWRDHERMWCRWFLNWREQRHKACEARDPHSLAVLRIRVRRGLVLGPLTHWNVSPPSMRGADQAQHHKAAHRCRLPCVPSCPFVVLSLPPTNSAFGLLRASEWNAPRLPSRSCVLHLRSSP